MAAIGGQELSMPVVHPAELWRETGRWHSVGPELVRFVDRGSRDMVLAMTHEDVVTDLLGRRVRSYREMPVMLYQLQTKFRDEPRARGGLIRTRVRHERRVLRARLGRGPGNLLPRRLRSVQSSYSPLWAGCRGGQGRRGDDGRERSRVADIADANEGAPRTFRGLPGRARSRAGRGTS